MEVVEKISSLFEGNKIEEIEDWLSENNIIDVEVLVSDYAGIARGKSMTSDKFVSAMQSQSLRIPETLYAVTVGCDEISNEYMTDVEKDVYLLPDISTLAITPWRDSPTAFVICDLASDNDKTVDYSPRQILKNILSLYEEKGWKPVIAPEFEFYLIGQQDDWDNPIEPAKGRSGKVAWDKGLLSIDALDEFGELFKEVTDHCKAMNINLNTLSQEMGPAQFEFNIGHGDPLTLADQAFLFKRAIKRTAIRHGAFASFMAKPYPKEYGSSMHLHQSIVDSKSGEILFADEDGNDTKLFLSHIAGLQKYIPYIMLLFAPYTNSYQRIAVGTSSPVNTQWGRENRSLGLRIPDGEDRNSRRIENRIIGSDVNPYLAIAGSLLCGYLGMIEELSPTEAITDSAYDHNSGELPQDLTASINKMEECEVLTKYLGKEFIAIYLDVKRQEFKESGGDSNESGLSEWEKKYLLE